ncbi:LysR family transcriptional regulator, hydrogen peroxide-inducible genes activator [Mucilaginibacter pineti]|uniref:LysR family transcriptional regulator, hydrogen peroxide-inducible genes activator n=1 Tax=Mucilaginibacter pineti TaxID=1391627 RepID=A0A1G7JYE3_9SPHI|nr:LysR substrate-binding domain-containing protein [Mucilaginibacter pineti]SDF29821.1 LysR family transcriptional regulator, hydrogen peroxide-inducible genes activator [Mucilaginibacter pineti]
MTLIQLKYIISLDTYRHFSVAAEHCFVSQPTLSMQLQKAEDELGLRIFDRSKQPLIPTEHGAEVIEQARRILAECEVLDQLASFKTGVIAGELRIGIIPTLAPYLLPLLLPVFTRRYPKVRLVISELITPTIVSYLRQGKIDVGILATPLNESGINEIPLFYEELLAFVAKDSSTEKKVYLLPSDIDTDRLWLLEESHCLRSQIENLCELKKAHDLNNQITYESGSIETLKRMVDTNDGITILPELAVLNGDHQQKKQLRYFKAPAPMRQISLIVHRGYIKRKLISLLEKEIKEVIPEKVLKNKPKHIVPIVI